MVYGEKSFGVYFNDITFIIIVVYYFKQTIEIDIHR